MNRLRIIKPRLSLMKQTFRNQLSINSLNPQKNGANTQNNFSSQGLPKKFIKSLQKYQSKYLLNDLNNQIELNKQSQQNNKINKNFDKVKKFNREKYLNNRYRKNNFIQKSTIAQKGNRKSQNQDIKLQNKNIRPKKEDIESQNQIIESQQKNIKFQQKNLHKKYKISNNYMQKIRQISKLESQQTKWRCIPLQTVDLKAVLIVSLQQIKQGKRKTTPKFQQNKRSERFYHRHIVCYSSRLNRQVNIHQVKKLNYQQDLNYQNKYGLKYDNDSKYEHDNHYNYQRDFKYDLNYAHDLINDGDDLKYQDQSNQKINFRKSNPPKRGTIISNFKIKQQQLKGWFKIKNTIIIEQHVF